MAQHPKDGGPAFPVQNAQYTEAYSGAPGMTLRDWFAGQALAGYLASFAGRTGDPGPERAAKYVYSLADAMLSERSETEGL